jgi:hypothetical protein
MKLFTTLSLSLFCALGFSQDVITKKDGTTLKVKVTEVTEEVIKYKKFENLEGPSYTLETGKILKIKYENGSEETYAPVENQVPPSQPAASNGEKPVKLINDPNFKRQVEAISKDAGEQLLENCSFSKDNSGTDIYWDGVYKDTQTGDITIPIRVWWNKKWAPDGNKKSIRGKVIVYTNGKKKWVYQSAEGVTFTGCAENLRLN